MRMADQPRGAPYFEVTIVQGAEDELDFFVEEKDGSPVNCTGGIVRSHAKRSFADPTPQLTWIGSVVNGLTGQVRLRYTEGLSAAVSQRRGIGDCEVALPSGRVVRFGEYDWKLARNATV